MINSVGNSNSDLSFKSLRSIKLERFGDNPEVGIKVLRRFVKNEGVCAFIDKYDSDLRIINGRKGCKLILDVINPNREKAGSFIEKLFIAKKIRISNETDIWNYLDPTKRSRFVETGTVGTNCSMGYYSPNNINNDMEAADKLIRETSPVRVLGEV